MLNNPEADTRSQDREHIRHKLALLPEQSGCYLMKNKEGKVIYVGKAKILKNRVRSYFTGSHDAKTQRLVTEIHDFEYIVTGSNVEALILECNLIKQYVPRYNVLLKDDKSFPYIKITNEVQPRLEVTRNLVKDKAKYFGPYPNAYAAQQTKKLLDRLYPLRKCKTLPDKVCLYYHIHQCLAPCVYDIDRETNEKMVQEIIRFLNGGHDHVKRDLTERMHMEAEQLNFERAKELRDQISHIDAVMQKQAIQTSEQIDRDIFGYAVDNGWMSVHILYMRQGKMVERHASTFPYYGEAYDDFITYVSQYYSENPALPKEILLPEPDIVDESIPTDQREQTPVTPKEVQESLQEWLKIKVFIPQRGDKKKMVEMACDNAKIALEEKFMLIQRDEERTVRAAANLGEWIGIGQIQRIEAFDNSNIMGTDPVSAMVVFLNGKPAKKEYRKYKIRHVKGPDDYETMREVIRRRYTRVLKENLPLPDLIIVDGGKGQISAAVDVLENELGLFIPVGGLVKDDKHRTAQLLIGDPAQAVSLPRHSQEFYLLQRIQDEVHRFAITFHRETKRKSMVASQLDAIPGIGEKRRKLLLKHFGSLKNMKSASIEDFRAMGIGEKLAQNIIVALNNEVEEQQ